MALTQEEILSPELKAMGATLIQQGAEARVFEAVFMGKKTIIKERFAKRYRHPVLDQRLRQQRIVMEARCMVKARKIGVDTPALYFVDDKTCRLYMECVEGHKIRDILFAVKDEDYSIAIARAIGNRIALLHEAGIIHGDLTTSNMMLRGANSINVPPEGAALPPLQLVMIDFGLSFTSKMVEDKAVDLYVLERAFISTHPNSEPLFEAVLKSYVATSHESPAVIKRLDKVRARGRKKLAFG